MKSIGSPGLLRRCPQLLPVHLRRRPAWATWAKCFPRTTARRKILLVHAVARLPAACPRPCSRLHRRPVNLPVLSVLPRTVLLRIAVRRPPVPPQAAATLPRAVRPRTVLQLAVL